MPAQQFDLADPDSGVVLESRTLNAPGATTGDVLTVNADDSISPAPGGGSMPGALGSAEFLFTEEATAGTYTATLDVLEGTVVLDVLGYYLAEWALDPNNDSLAILIGDSLNPDGYYNQTNLLNVTPGAYSLDPVQVTNQGTFIVSSQNAAGAYQNGGYGVDQTGSANSGLGMRYPADDTITLTVTTFITSPPVVPTGLLLFKIIYLAPVTAVNAVFS